MRAVKRERQIQSGDLKTAETTRGDMSSSVSCRTHFIKDVERSITCEQGIESYSSVQNTGQSLAASKLILASCLSPSLIVGLLAKVRRSSISNRVSGACATMQHAVSVRQWLTAFRHRCASRSAHHIGLISCTRPDTRQPASNMSSP